MCIGVLGDSSLEQENAMVNVIRTLKDGNNLDGLGALGDMLLSYTRPYEMSILVPPMIKLEYVSVPRRNVN
jgi:hypothetical protein